MIDVYHILIVVVVSSLLVCMCIFQCRNNHYKISDELIKVINDLNKNKE